MQPSPEENSQKLDPQELVIDVYLFKGERGDDYEYNVSLFLAILSFLASEVNIFLITRLRLCVLKSGIKIKEYKE